MRIIQKGAVGSAESRIDFSEYKYSTEILLDKQIGLVFCYGLKSAMALRGRSLTIAPLPPKPLQR
ncbi:hypothetical protein C8B47_23085 [filamentous cyanobacterium CCP4]|nr:hypothetical protein C8B47_23085 [filamentous cyanobacterium CCP4]